MYNKMTGEILKEENNWFVKYPDYKIPESGKRCNQIIKTPLHPESLSLIKYYSNIFKDIDNKILSVPKVEFELIKDYNNPKIIYAKIKNL